MEHLPHIKNTILTQLHNTPPQIGHLLHDSPSNLTYTASSPIPPTPNSLASSKIATLHDNFVTALPSIPIPNNEPPQDPRTRMDPSHPLPNNNRPPSSIQPRSALTYIPTHSHNPKSHPNPPHPTLHSSLNPDDDELRAGTTHLEAIHRQEPAEDAFLETGAQHNDIVLFIHGFALHCPALRCEQSCGSPQAVCIVG
jgi:hypothetical protein